MYAARVRKPSAELLSVIVLREPAPAFTAVEAELQREAELAYEYADESRGDRSGACRGS